jgi:tellurite resistance protein TerC
VVVSLWVWIAFIAFVLGALALDLGLSRRGPRVIATREAARRTAIWIAAALVFAGLLAWREGVQAGVNFLTGYAVEQALSVDNVVVMALIFSSLGIPPEYQHRVLLWGVLGAMVMRGGFIVLGLVLLTRFGWVQYVLGAVLLLAALRMLYHGEPETTGRQSLLVRAVEFVIPVEPTLMGSPWVARDAGRNNRVVASPLLIALICIELSDIAFATDSIPAIFAITRQPFIVFTATIFATLGLRSLYFLVAAEMRRLHSFRIALAVILAIVALKMLLASVVEVPTGLVLGVIVAVLAVARLVSGKAPAPDHSRAA